MLNERPASKPGTRYEYSNAGFVTAGAMLETLTGKSWEELMKKRIFEPLGMKSAGFGAPATGTQEDQPWPHSDSKTPVSGAVTDNPAILGPAGTVHVSLVDLAKYVRMHLLQETGPVLKKKATFTFLHAPPKNNNSYACGWFVANRDWAKGHTLSHSGSNTMNFCTIWVAPKIKFASIVVTNTGEKGIGNVCDKAISESIRHFLN
jgi:CubicO group peptidase (beta-lactamase class C family)